MKKTIYLLNIDNYSPEITAITYPLIERYAKKIQADIVYITERKTPEASAVYEKLQIYEMEKERQSDWIIYIDSDALVHPDTFDFTAILPDDTIFQYGNDFSPTRFRPNEHMLKDKRFIGTCNWFTVVPKKCIELFNPDIGMTLEEIYAECFPTQAESFRFDRKHLIDDYIVSTNLAKHGFNYMTMKDLNAKYSGTNGDWFHHNYLISEDEKIRRLKEHQVAWCETDHVMIDIENRSKSIET